jgi:hypothetical protein
MLLHAKGVSWLSAREEGRPSRTYRPGRVCQKQGCGTRLSIYNEGPRCAVHDRERSRSRVETIGHDRFRLDADACTRGGAARTGASDDPVWLSLMRVR